MQQSQVFSHQEPYNILVPLQRCNKNPCPTESGKILLWKTMQIQIRQLLQKPADQDPQFSIQLWTHACLWNQASGIRRRGYKTFFTLKTTGYEISTAHKNINLKKDFSCFKTLSKCVFIMLISVKMPTIVGILALMSMINFMLNWVVHEKSFITSRPDMEITYPYSADQGSILLFWNFLLCHINAVSFGRKSSNHI